MRSMRDGENGHELFMNASMKGGKVVGVGRQTQHGCLQGTPPPKSILPLSKFVPAAPSLLHPLAGKTIEIAAKFPPIICQST